MIKNKNILNKIFFVGILLYLTLPITTWRLWVFKVESSVRSTILSKMYRSTISFKNFLTKKPLKDVNIRFLDHWLRKEGIACVFYKGKSYSVSNSLKGYNFYFDPKMVNNTFYYTDLGGENCFVFRYRDLYFIVVESSYPFLMKLYTKFMYWFLSFYFFSFLLLLIFYLWLFHSYNKNYFYTYLFQSLLGSSKLGILVVQESQLEEFSYKIKHLNSYANSLLKHDVNTAMITSSSLVESSSNFVEIKLKKDSIKVLVRAEPIHFKNFYLIYLKDPAEEEFKELKKLKAQKYQNVGKLVFSVAHDLNNILGGVLMNLSVLRSENSHMESSMELIKSIENIASKGKDTLRSLKNFTNSDNFKKEILDFEKIITESFSIVKILLPNSNCLRLILSNSLSTEFYKVQLDPTLLHMLVQNLVINSYHALEAKFQNKGLMEEPNITVFIDTLEVLSGMKLHFGSIPMGKYVSLSIKDNGIGISKEELANIFTPYFTTKDDCFEGSGLGLSTVKSIIRSQEAYLDLKSESNVGTEFRIYFNYLSVKKKF